MDHEVNAVGRKVNESYGHFPRSWILITERECLSVVEVEVYVYKPRFMPWRLRPWHEKVKTGYSK